MDIFWVGVIEVLTIIVFFAFGYWAGKESAKLEFEHRIFLLEAELILEGKYDILPKPPEPSEID